MNSTPDSASFNLRGMSSDAASRWIGVSSVIMFALVAFVFVRTAPAASDAVSCPERARVVLVESSAHVLALCEEGRTERVFSVRLGRGGLGKMREGDRKTPLGEYALGAPRRSDRFGTFVPINYPTQEQRLRGYTGSAIGVHGPNRIVRWLGVFVNALDTTDGCIGIATDAEMDVIARWIRERDAQTILIR